MSEYRYYEFLAIDRTLSQRERDELRAISSRATITATSFKNEYDCGDLKADPRTLLERYFDVHVYKANWGTRRLALRLPADAVSRPTIARYFRGESASVRKVARYVIVDIWSECDEPDDWEESGDRMGSLAPLRGALLRGDMRPAYIAWLASVGADELADDEPEPPCPPGLGSMSSDLESLADFLHVDPYLIAAAAEASTEETAELPGLADWIATLPAKSKDSFLTRVAEGEATTVAAALIRRFRRATGTTSAASGTPRTVGAIRDRAAELCAEVAKKRERRNAAKQRRLEEALAAERTRALEALAVRGSAVWQEVCSLVATSKPKGYESAITRLVDLREIASRKGNTDEFVEHLAELLAAHGHRPAFVRRLHQAGLLEHDN